MTRLLSLRPWRSWRSVRGLARKSLQIWKGSREEPTYRAAAVSLTRITILPIQSILLILSFVEAKLRAKARVQPSARNDAAIVCQSQIADVRRCAATRLVSTSALLGSSLGRTASQ